MGHIATLHFCSSFGIQLWLLQYNHQAVIALNVDRISFLLGGVKVPRNLTSILHLVAPIA